MPFGMWVVAMKQKWRLTDCVSARLSTLRDATACTIHILYVICVSLHSCVLLRRQQLSRWNLRKDKTLPRMICGLYVYLWNSLNFSVLFFVEIYFESILFSRSPFLSLCFVVCVCSCIDKRWHVMCSRCDLSPSASSEWWKTNLMRQIEITRVVVSSLIWFHVIFPLFADHYFQWRKPFEWQRSFGLLSTVTNSVLIHFKLFRFDDSQSIHPYAIPFAWSGNSRRRQWDHDTSQTDTFHSFVLSVRWLEVRLSNILHTTMCQNE